MDEGREGAIETSSRFPRALFSAIALATFASGARAADLQCFKFAAGILAEHPRLKITRVVIMKGVGSDRHLWRTFPLEGISHMGPVVIRLFHPGVYTVTSVAENGASTDHDVAVDHSPPALTASLKRASPCADPHLGGTVSDDICGVKQLRITFEGSRSDHEDWISVARTVLQGPDKEWTVPLPASSVPDGVTRLRASVVATDGAGNESSVTTSALPWEGACSR